MTDIGGIKGDTQREIQNRIRALERKGEFDGTFSRSTMMR